MKHEDILNYIGNKLSFPASEIEEIINAYYDAVTEAIAEGSDVELGSLGRAVTRMRDGIPASGSPRTPKKSHYAVVLKISSALKKRLNDPT